MADRQWMATLLEHIKHGPCDRGTAGDFHDRSAMQAVIDRVTELEESVGIMADLIDVQNEAIQSLGQKLFRRAGVIQ